MLRGLTTPEASLGKARRAVWQCGSAGVGSIEEAPVLEGDEVRPARAGRRSRHGSTEVCHCASRLSTGRSDMLADRETMAEVVGSLPADSQQRWYHRRGGRGENQMQKGRSLLAWLEEERADAIAIRLDAMARKAKTSHQPHRHHPSLHCQRVAPISQSTRAPTPPHKR